MPHVEMYCSKTCPFCKNAEKLLLSKGVEIDIIDIDDEPVRFDEMVDRAHRDTVPQIFIDGRHVGGFDDLSELDMDGELDQWLGI